MEYRLGVKAAFTLAETIATFNDDRQDRFRRGLARLVAVGEGDVSIDVAMGSIIVTASVTPQPGHTPARQAAAILANTPLPKLGSAMNVTIESMSLPAVSPMVASRRQSHMPVPASDEQPLLPPSQAQLPVLQKTPEAALSDGPAPPFRASAWLIVSLPGLAIVLVLLFILWLRRRQCFVAIGSLRTSAKESKASGDQSTGPGGRLLWLPWKRSANAATERGSAASAAAVLAKSSMSTGKGDAPAAAESASSISLQDVSVALAPRKAAPRAAEQVPDSARGSAYEAQFAALFAAEKWLTDDGEAEEDEDESSSEPVATGAPQKRKSKTSPAAAPSAAPQKKKPAAVLPQRKKGAAVLPPSPVAPSKANKVASSIEPSRLGGSRVDVLLADWSRSILDI